MKTFWTGPHCGPCILRVLLSLSFGLWIAAFPVAVSAQEGLATRVDQLILAKAANQQISPAAEDAEFVRRVWLDLAGRIPTPAETRAFLTDPAPDKRLRLIDTLLAGPDYPRRMREQFHVVLMERLGEHPEWLQYLQSSFAANKPWNQMVREMLSPDAEQEATRGAAFFLSKRLENYGQQPVDLPALTRDVGRLFLGLDLQCAQCHDHLFVEDYKQADFQGLHTYFLNTYLRTDRPFPAVGEKPLTKKTEFMSVFKKEPYATGPRVPGLAEVMIPELKAGEEYATPPDKQKNFPGVLKFSPLQLLGEQLPTANNTAFARNIANRVWAQLMGRGIVHPLDLHHSGNPPSHPELLDLLAQELVAHQYDLKWLIRELCQTQVYQRSSRLAGDVEPPPELFLTALEKPLSAEQLLNSCVQATGGLPGTMPPPDDVRQKFLKAFANPPRDPEGEFAPSVKACLFVMNDGLLLSWLEPQAGRLTARLAELTDSAAVADELYISVLSRPPTAAETTRVQQFLENAGDKRPQRIKWLTWSLLAATEFCVNH